MSGLDFSSEWDCPKCGFHNGGYKGFCSQCNAQRPWATTPAPGPPAAPAGPGAPSPPVPPGAPAAALRRSALGPRAVVTILALSVAAGAGLWLVAGSSGGGTHYPTRWDPRVEPIARFVERTRGLTFQHPVAVDFLPVDTFKAKVGDNKPLSAKDRQELEVALGELRAVGLVTGTVNLAALENRLVQESVIGLYDYRARHVFVRGDNLAPDARATLAHELTHALQDQYYDLRDKSRAATSGADTAYRALYEADAVRVEQAYVDQLSPDDRRVYDAAQLQDSKEANVQGIPEALIDDFSFPYAFGPYFLKALLDQGGNPSVDAAFGRPPKTEAEIVQPDLYQSGWAAATVDPPRLGAGETRLDKPSDMGQVSQLEVLGARLGYVRAWDAVRGWAGDSAVPYRQRGRVCVAIDTALDNSADALRYASAAGDWATSMPAASSVRRGQVVELRSCDPGPGLVLKPQDPTPFTGLQLRQEVAQTVRESAQVAIPLAECVADRLIARLGPAAVEAAGQASPGDPRLAAVQAGIVEAATACRANAASNS